MKPRLMIVFFAAGILAGCAEARTLEKIGLITTIGYDLTEDNQIRSTLILLEIDPDAEQGTGILTSTANTSKGARIRSDLKSPKGLQSGQLRVALYSDEIAKKGIITLADTLARDPSISDLTYLAIVDGSTHELLKHENEQFTDIGQYVFKELDQNIKGELIPSSTLQETIHDFYAQGVDPILPILKAEKGHIEISGVALMEKDKMTGRISPSKAFYLKLINDRYKAGSLELKLNEAELGQALEGHELTELAIVLDTIHSKSKIKLKNREIPEFDLVIDLDARLLEINQTYDMKLPENVKKLEEAISNKMKKEIESLIDYSKSRNSDPFGFGEIYRKSVRNSNLTNSKWHDMFKDSKVNVVVDLSILRTGVVE